MTINERLDELYGLNMMAHTRDVEKDIGNHLIALRRHIERDTAIIEIIDNIKAHYPTDIFGDWTSKDLKELHEYLKTQGRTLDSLSASYGRTYCDIIKDAIEKARDIIALEADNNNRI